MEKNKEPKATQNLFQSDIDILKRFMDRQGKEKVPTFADAARIAIEYATAHGALS